MARGFSTQWQTISEAAELMRELTVSTSHGASISGEHVQVLVSSEWNGSEGTFSLILTCFPLGRPLLDWKGLPVMVTPS